MLVVFIQQKLQQELVQAQQMALNLDDKLQENTDFVELLYQFSQRYSHASESY